MFYVYIHSSRENVILYVGKGSNDNLRRAYRGLPKPYWDALGVTITILGQFQTSKEALNFEAALIKKWNPLANRNGQAPEEVRLERRGREQRAHKKALAVRPN